MNALKNYLHSPFVRSDKPAIIFFKGLHSLQNSVSFNELYVKAQKAQKYLKESGHKKGDSLLLFEEPSADLYAFILASLGLGIKLMIVEPWMKAEAINQVLKKVQPKSIMTKSIGKAVLLRAKESKNIQHSFQSNIINQFSNENLSELEAIEVMPEDHAILTFTSGTSGNPKGVHRKHQYLIDQTSVLKKYLPYENCNKLDLTVFTNIVLLNLSLGKGSLVIPSKWKGSTLRQLDHLPDEFQVDTLACGPAFLHKLMKNTQKLDLKAFHIGGALADVALYEKALKRWPNAQMHHVYGSTEAEPVMVSDLKIAVQKSKEQGYHQTLFLGEPIDEIDMMTKDGSLWVSGIHVSPMYENDNEANQKNKFLDENGKLWHNMGDRLKEIDGKYYYNGRSFQSVEEFSTEQSIYSHLKSSASYIEKHEGKSILIGEKLSPKAQEIKNEFKLIDDIVESKIHRDVRHKARIDRVKSYRSAFAMKNITKFILERVPIIPNLILAFGLVYSASYVLNLSVPIDKLILLISALFIFITELRFMDELKDYDKDIIAHPDRPLPRGLVTTKNVFNLIAVFFIGLIVLTFLSGVYYSLSGGIFLGVTTLWLFLMYKEFFIGNALSKSPIIYAITHQLIILPIVFFVLSILGDGFTITQESIGFSLLILSSFFTFEVGRKMDPNANKVLGTYLVHYGKNKTHILITILLSLGLIGGVLLNKLLWVLVPFLLVVITQVRVYKKESIFKDLEGIIALSLIYNMWLLVISGAF